MQDRSHSLPLDSRLFTQPRVTLRTRGRCRAGSTKFKASQQQRLGSAWKLIDVNLGRYSRGNFDKTGWQKHVLGIWYVIKLYENIKSLIYFVESTIEM